MPVITVGKMRPEHKRTNRDGMQWMRGTVELKPICRPLLYRIGQRKLPFTIVTARPIPKRAAILLGEFSEYKFPDGKTWLTLDVHKFIDSRSQAFRDLGVSLTEACRRIEAGDQGFLDQLGAIELVVREKLNKLFGERNSFTKNLMDLFQEQAYDELVKNPWRMMHVLPYFTITQADKVAEKLGIPLDDKRRHYEYFRYLLDKFFESRHNTYLTREEMAQFYQLHFAGVMPAEELKELALSGEVPLVQTSLGYHPKHMYLAERASYQFICQGSHRLPKFEKEDEVTKDILAEIGFTPTKEQEHAIRNTFHNPLHVITGGPGTGKTTVLDIILKKMVRLLGDPSMFLLAAPTGKAAYRMWEQTGMPALTIHSAFNIKPGYGCLDKEGALRRLAFISFIIIDEASMLDTVLFGEMCSVMLRMDPMPYLLLVGDVDQLHPVQHGQVFKDILNYLSENAPECVTRLTVIKRQADGSSIPELAAFIRNGKFPGEAWFQGRDDVFFAPVTMESFHQTLVDSVLLPKKGSVDTIQIITPYRNGDKPDTMHAINSLVEPLYNQLIPYGDVPGIMYEGKTFRVGDKVIIRKNMSEYIVNGSIGYITAIDCSSPDTLAWMMDIELEDGAQRTLLYEDFKHLDLAYAITAHASQGSEYENVVVCILRGNAGPEFLNRNLLYVAATRTSGRVVFLGQMSLFTRMAATPAGLRNTALAAWLSGRIDWEEGNLR